MAESLLLRAGEGFLEVEGIYTYEWTGAHPWSGGFVYPFAPGKVLWSEVAGRAGTGSGAWKSLPVQGCADGLHYPMPGEATDPVAQVRVRYRQATEGMRATYLTTTTRTWGRPLDLAQFIIEIPSPHRLESCTYPVAWTEPRPGAIRHHIRLPGFWPDQDLTFSWR